MFLATTTVFRPPGRTGVTITRRRKATHRLAGLIVLAAVTLTGCATIPTIKPFDEQTSRMVSGIKTGYTSSQLSLATLSPEDGKKLAEAWAPTAVSLNAVVAYSKALTSLAEQGGKGAESANALAGALDGVITSIGFGSIPGGVASAIAELNKNVAAMRARRSLQEAVGAAQPAIDKISLILADQLVDLASLHELTAITTLGTHRRNHQEMVDYIEAEQRAEARVLRILRRVLDYHEAVGSRDATEELSSIKQLDPTVTATNVTAVEAKWIKQVKSHRAHLEPYAVPYAEYLQKQDEIATAQRAGAMTFRKAQRAVHAWAGAHGKLRATLDEKQPLDLFDFFAAVRDVSDAFVDAQAAAN
jgi:hypothetical protein